MSGGIMRELHPAIPRVHCPSCGAILRLIRIRPDPSDKPIMEFACDCGFDDRMSARARNETLCRRSAVRA
jgi:hypothetical protein